jgi:hypothetical protein
MERIALDFLFFVADLTRRERHNVPIGFRPARIFGWSLGNLHLVT